MSAANFGGKTPALIFVAKIQLVRIIAEAPESSMATSLCGEIAKLLSEVK